MLSVTRKGNGAPVVFVHGYFGGAGHWADQIAHFGERYDTIAVNLAGFGDSAHLTAPESIEAHAEMVWHTLDVLGIERAILVGHSMGGMVVQQMTAMAPSRVVKLVAYGTGPTGNLPGRFETLDESRQRLLVEGTGVTMRRIAETWLVDGEMSPGFATCLTEGTKGTQQAALASLIAWEGWDGTAALGSIAAPTLIVWGELDRSYPRSQPDALLAGISGSRLEVMSGCAHAAHLEQVELFNRHLDTFFAQ